MSREAWRAVVLEIYRCGHLHIFSDQMLRTVRAAARNEPGIQLEEFKQPRKLPPFVSPVVAHATWVGGEPLPEQRWARR